MNGAFARPHNSPPATSFSREHRLTPVLQPLASHITTYPAKKKAPHAPARHLTHEKAHTPMALDTLKSLLEDQVKDLYSAENQLIKALPKMAKKATSPQLKELFTSHLEQTRGHVERARQAAALLEIKPGGKKCKAMEGLIEEGKEVIEEDGEVSVIDSALVAAALRVEHYEIAAYSYAADMADALGNKELANLFRATLKEEEAAGSKLNRTGTSELLPATPKNDADDGK